MRIVAARRHGFTLIEVLVVLAIMVILFGLLFAPMMTSIDMASQGRNRARMQDAMRLAIEQIKRDLNEAILIFPPETVRLPGPDGTYGTTDDQFLVNHSVLTLARPAKNAAGQVIEPLRLPVERVAGPNGVLGDGDDVWLTRVVRFAVHTPKMVQRVLPGSVQANLAGVDQYYYVSTTPGKENPFVLYRQEGWVRYNAAAGIYEFGSYAVPVDGGPTLEFIIGRPDIENALSPTDRADFPVTTTVSRTSGAMAPGYIDVSLNLENDPWDDTLANPPAAYGFSPGDVNLVYLHSGVQFNPLHIAGEWLVPTADGVLYRAQHGNWLGYQSDGTYTLAQALALGLLNNSELSPHIMVKRYTDPANPANPPYASNVVVNSRLGVVPAWPEVRWDARAGAVRIGHSFSATITVTNPNAPVTPGAYFALSISDSEGGAVTYGTDGSSSGGSSIVTPIYPALPTNAQDPAMPIAFGIDPTAGGLFPQAKIVKDSLRVWVGATYAGTGVTQWTELSPTSDSNQQNIGMTQFCPYLTDAHGLTAQLRFNRWQPPGPPWFGPPGTLAAAPDGFRIYIVGTIRRNFDPITYEDDRVVVSYHTTEVMDIRLTLCGYQDLVDRNPAAPEFVLVPEEAAPSVTVHDQVQVRNLGR